MFVPQGLIPSLLVPEVYAPWKAEPGFVVRQIERAAREEFYRSIEIGPIGDPADRTAIREICRSSHIQVSVWLTQVLDEESLDLTSIDETLRERSVELIKRALPQATESGASTIALVGGRDPGPALRERGYDSFVTSLTAICAAAADLGAAVMFEPLDRFAHKKRLIGPTDEAVAAIARVRSESPTFGLAFDTAHSALNEEDIAAALAMAREQIINLHLSNAVLEKETPLYGDHHIVPGAPGFLTVERAAAIVAETLRLGIGPARGLRVAVETRARPTDDRQSVAETASAFLSDVFARAMQLLPVSGNALP